MRRPLSTGACASRSEAGVSGPSSVVAVERKTPASASEETSSRAEVGSQAWKLYGGVLPCLLTRALIVFFTPLLGVLLVVWMNIRFVRSHIGNWNSRFTILFVLSLGQFRQKQKEVWRLRAGYDETEANIIIKYQMLCLLEISLGFFISILARHHFLHP
jgi:hypothetical protein